MNKKQASLRTAIALGAVFGTKSPRIIPDVSRNKRIITRKNKHGAAVQMLSFNEAKALLAAQGMDFDSNAELEKALWDGTTLKNGDLLRDSYFTQKGMPTQYAD
jgi:hypothetical protein